MQAAQEQRRDSGGSSSSSEPLEAMPDSSGGARVPRVQRLPLPRRPLPRALPSLPNRGTSPATGNESLGERMPELNSGGVSPAESLLPSTRASAEEATAISETVAAAPTIAAANGYADFLIPAAQGFIR